MERALGWGGVLIEANPSSFQKLVSKHRKSWLVPAALSNSEYPKWAQRRAIHSFESTKILWFYSILLAANRTTIDFFSLDVEGSELDVLKTIPWDKVDIKVISRASMINYTGNTLPFTDPDSGIRSCQGRKRSCQDIPGTKRLPVERWNHHGVLHGLWYDFR